MTEAAHAPTFEAPTIEQIAELFPNYEVVDLIACGGMGAVYQAVQRSLDRTVAIKILPREFGADPDFRQSFEDEAKAMAKLNHPSLIGVYDFGEVDGMLFIVMEYVAGGSLYQASHGKRIDPREAARIVAAVCDGLASAHEHGILHRDIKPANILLDLQARPKIGDFGLARPIGAHEDQTKTVFGTPHYTAPEVLDRPTAVDARADIFSIGVILHELLTGQLPANDPRLPSMISNCDIRFDTIVRTATNPMSELRYDDASVMARDLHELEQALGRATHAVNLVAPANRAPAPVRRSNTPVRVGRASRMKTETTGWFSAALILGAVIVLAWLILKYGGQITSPEPPAPPVNSTSEATTGTVKATSGSGESSAFGSTSPPRDHGQ